MNDTGIRGFCVALMLDGSTCSPSIVETRPDPPHPRRRSREMDALIIGGGAGGGALIGAVTGGKNCAARYK